MRMKKNGFALWFAFGVVLFFLGGCSMKKNTAFNRFYQAFTTRYNVYYNGSVAFRDGMDAIESGNKDYYAGIIPLDPISNKNTVGQGASQFDRAIEKSEKAIKLHSIRKKPLKKTGKISEKKKLWYKQKEFNPFLYNAWMMMGKSQYWKGEYLEAAATFSYIARLYENNPEVLSLARIWLSRCYAQLDWFYDAENLLQQVQTEGYPKKYTWAYDYSYADYLLRQQRYEDAIPYLRRVIRGEKRKKQRQRELFLLGQIYQYLGKKQEAYSTYGKLIRKSPPYEMEFNARIRQTEVMASAQTKKVVSKLKRMAHSLKNKDFLDQIYYALGNVWLVKGDTVKAMQEYRLAAEKSTRNGKEKAVALLTLANLCWDRMEHEEAQRCYKEALGLIDKEYPGYEQLAKRSEVLDELVEYSTAVHLQDSLQHLASLPEVERIRTVDGIIEALKKQEAEERKKQEEAELLAKHEEDQAKNAPQGNKKPVVPPTVSTGDKSWYFYNPQLIAQGKTLFESQWGRRKLEDNWRRRNKTTVSRDDEMQGVDYAKEDSLMQARQISVDSLANDSAAQAAAVADSLGNDPHQREYYLKQIPTTPEMMEESNKILSDGLFNMGLIYKDKLEDESLATKTWARLRTQFPEYEKLDEVYYNLYLMYLRWNKPEEAEEAKALLLSQFPGSKYALTIGDPDYLANVLYGKQLEDSLYASTYNAFKQRDFSGVRANDEYAAQKYAMGQHRAKFLFLHAMSALQQGDRKTFLDKLKDVVQNYPQNEITPLATEIMKGLQNGRLLAEGGNFGSIWQLRNSELANDTIGVDSLDNFQAEKNSPYLFLLAYPTGELNEDHLLYEIARFNFSSFIVKDFDLSFAQSMGISMLIVKPFASYDEAAYYMRLLYKDTDLATILEGIRPVIISERNYQLLMKLYSFDDYAKFFKEHFGGMPAVKDAGALPQDEPGSTLDEPLQNLPELPADGGGEAEPEQEEDEFID